MTAPTSPLADWLAYLKIESCSCPYKWKSLGRDYGDGWVRMDTRPGCPEHNPALASERDRTGGRSSGSAPGSRSG